MIQNDNLHAHYVLHLFSPITNTQFALFKGLCHLLLSIRILARQISHVLHQSLYISHSQELGDERLWCKPVEIV